MRVLAGFAAAEAGKSTMLKLLLGFDEPAAGRVLIDSQDIRRLNSASLGSRIDTVMLVTHRLASAAFVEHVVVMDQGQVREEGRHEDLLACSGLPHQLRQMLNGFVVSGDGRYAEVSGEGLRAIPLFRDVDINTLEAAAGRFVSQCHAAGG